MFLSLSLSEINKNIFKKRKKKKKEEIPKNIPNFKKLLSFFLDNTAPHTAVGTVPQSGEAGGREKARGQLPIATFPTFALTLAAGRRGVLATVRPPAGASL
jgi:hypothetical protein